MNPEQEQLVQKHIGEIRMDPLLGAARMHERGLLVIELARKVFTVEGTMEFPDIEEPTRGMMLATMRGVTQLLTAQDEARRLQVANMTGNIPSHNPHFVK